MNALTQDSKRAANRLGLVSDTIVIDGGTPLHGTVEVRGAKNLVTKAMVAALLAESSSTLRDVPAIADVGVVANMLGVYGVNVATDGDGTYRFDPSNVERAHFAEIGRASCRERVCELV